MRGGEFLSGLSETRCKRRLACANGLVRYRGRLPAIAARTNRRQSILQRPRESDLGLETVPNVNRSRRSRPTQFPPCIPDVLIIRNSLKNDCPRAVHGVHPSAERHGRPVNAECSKNEPRRNAWHSVVRFVSAVPGVGPDAVSLCLTLRQARSSSWPVGCGMLESIDERNQCYLTGIRSIRAANHL
jgi:hypothetical protein